VRPARPTRLTPPSRGKPSRRRAHRCKGPAPRRRLSPRAPSSVVAQVGYNTRLVVSTTDRAAKFEFNADLDLEQVLDASGNPFAVSTPASVALNQSPSREQPCLAYA